VAGGALGGGGTKGGAASGGAGAPMEEAGGAAQGGMNDDPAAGGTSAGVGVRGAAGRSPIRADGALPKKEGVGTTDSVGTVPVYAGSSDGGVAGDAEGMAPNVGRGMVNSGTMGGPGAVAIA